MARPGPDCEGLPDRELGDWIVVVHLDVVGQLSRNGQPHVVERHGSVVGDPDLVQLRTAAAGPVAVQAGPAAVCCRDSPSEREAFAGRSGRGEVALFEPVRSAEVDRAARGFESPRERVALLGGIGHADGVTPADVAERPDVAHLHQDRSVGVTSHGHPCFEQDVRSGLSHR